jgi:hypothetical protein
MVSIQYAKISFVLMTIALVSCRVFNVIRTYPDEFKGSTKHILQQMVYPEDRRSPVGAVYLTYEKEVIPSQSASFNVYFVFSRGTTTFDIDRKGYLKIGDTKFELETQSMQSELKSGENTSTTTVVDSTGSKTVMSSETIHWINDKFKVSFSAEMMALLKQNSSMMFQFYSGPVPVRLKIENENMKKIHELVGF